MTKELKDLIHTKDNSRKRLSRQIGNLNRKVDDLMKVLLRDDQHSGKANVGQFIRHPQFAALMKLVELGQNYEAERKAFVESKNPFSNVGDEKLHYASHDASEKLKAYLEELYYEQPGFEE